jgi:hypothetical protein
MSDWAALDAFLRTDPMDVGCAQVMEMLDVYVELALVDTEAARTRFPGVAAHLRGCGPCHDDFEGLLAAISA